VRYLIKASVPIFRAGVPLKQEKGQIAMLSYLFVCFGCVSGFWELSLAWKGVAALEFRIARFRENHMSKIKVERMLQSMKIRTSASQRDRRSTAVDYHIVISVLLLRLAISTRLAAKILELLRWYSKHKCPRPCIHTQHY
jgi:hypothetical protein